MRSFSRIIAAAAFASLALAAPSLVAAADLPALSISGTAFVNPSGQRWLMKGVGYDYEVDDDSYAKWHPALEQLFSTLPDVNTLRLYVIEPSKSYTKFIAYTQSKGIYNIVPLTGADGCSVLNREGTPGLKDAQTCYPSCLLTWGQQVVNAWSGASNTLMFAVANEVMNDDARWQAAPCVKAYGRDIKAFMNACSSSMRYVPLIYTAADNPIDGFTAEANDRAKLDYLTCTDPNDSLNSQGIDAYGLNLFRWCNDQCSYATCGSKDVTAAMQGATVPMFLTEYGCSDFHLVADGGNNAKTAQRDWKETATLYSSNMASLWSGGSAYTYGVRGGMDFSFFSDGDQAATGNPGTTKTCGYPGNTCNIDNYATQLAGVKSFVAPAAASASSSATCPNFSKSSTVSKFNLQGIATRQGADGYTAVKCPNGNTPNIVIGGGNTNTNSGNTNTGNTNTGNTNSGNQTTTGNTNSNSGTGGSDPNGAAQVGLSAVALVGTVLVSSLLTLL